MTTNTFRVFVDGPESAPLFARSFPTFDEARRFLVAMLERKARRADEIEGQEGNAAAFRIAAASWAQDTEPGSGMLGDGNVYGVEIDEGEEPRTVRDFLSGLKGSRFWLDFFAFGSRADATETDFRYGRDFDDAKGPDAADVVGSRYLSGSDYSGGSLVRANIRAVVEILGEESPLVVKAHGGHNTLALYFRLDVPHENAGTVAEILSGLENYPVVSDDTLSEQEHEEAESAWAAWGAQDFRRELEARFALERDFLSTDEQAETFGTLFRAAEGDGNPLVEHEESGPYFRLEEAAGRIPAAFLFYVANVDKGETWRYGAEKALAEPDEARRILRMVRMGETLRALERALAVRLSNAAEPDEGDRAERMAQGHGTARRWILGATVDEGDTLAELDGPALERKADRGFRVVFKAGRFKGQGPNGFPIYETETLAVDFDPFDDGASVADAVGPILALFSKRD